MNPVRTAAVIGGAVLLQVTLLSQFSIAGARPDVVLLVVLAFAFVHGPDDGAIVGFAGGLALDVFISTPFGFTAFTYTVVGYAVGTWTAGVVRSAWWLAAVVLAAASAVAVFAQGLIGEVLGQDSLKGTPITTIVAVVSVATLLLAPLATRLAGWARADDRPRRRSIFAS